MESLRTMQLKHPLVRQLHGKVKGKRSKLRDGSGKIIPEKEKSEKTK